MALSSEQTYRKFNKGIGIEMFTNDQDLNFIYKSEVQSFTAKTVKIYIKILGLFRILRKIAKD